MEPNPVAESEISTQEETAKDENGKPTPNLTIESILKHESPPKDEVSIWGVPLLKDERSDVILLKFLRAREFKVKEAFAMLKNTIFWRKEFGIDALVNVALGEASCICDYAPPWSLLKITHGILIFTLFPSVSFMGFDFIYLFIDVDLVSGLVLNFVSVWLSVHLNGIYGYPLTV